MCCFVYSRQRFAIKFFSLNFSVAKFRALKNCYPFWTTNKSRKFEKENDEKEETERKERNGLKILIQKKT